MSLVLVLCASGIVGAGVYWVHTVARALTRTRTEVHQRLREIEERCLQMEEGHRVVAPERSDVTVVHSPSLVKPTCASTVTTKLEISREEVELTGLRDNMQLQVPIPSVADVKKTRNRLIAESELSLRSILRDQLS